MTNIIGLYKLDYAPNGKPEEFDGVLETIGKDEKGQLYLIEGDLSNPTITPIPTSDCGVEQYTERTYSTRPVVGAEVTVKDTYAIETYYDDRFDVDGDGTADRVVVDEMDLGNTDLKVISTSQKQINNQLFETTMKADVTGEAQVLWAPSQPRSGGATLSGTCDINQDGVEDTVVRAGQYHEVDGSTSTISTLIESVYAVKSFENLHGAHTPLQIKP